MASKEENGFIIDFISEKKVEATPEEVNAVQVFSKRLVEDYCYDKNQIQTRPQFRVRKHPSDERKEYPVDIAVFKNSSKTEENLFMIVECKQPKREEGVEQLKLYLDMSPAQVGVWFNGEEHEYLHKILRPDGSRIYEPLPNIPRKGQRIADIGKFKRKDLKAPHNLRAVFKDLRNHLAGLTTGITRDEVLAQQIINLLFCKIYDELNTGSEEMVTFRCGVNEDKDEVKKRICDLFENNVKSEYSDIFDKTDVITLDSDSITYIVGELQNYCVIDAERQALGDAFEVFIGPALKGSEGQFFTPRNVVKLAVKILDPQPNEFVIDPACGSGGFLIVALEHVWEEIRKEGERRKLGEEWIKNRQKKLATEYFRGIDKDRFLHKVTKAYMAIVGDGREGIFCENTLFLPTSWSPETQKKIKLGTFEVLFTNPPFGIKIPIKGEGILKQYPNLGFKWKRREDKWKKTVKLQKQQPPQILFIERCLQLLEEGGRMAIVLPDGILGGTKAGYIAHTIINKTRIIALIDCPIETFTSMTKTHLVLLQKKKRGVDYSNYPIFMAIAEKVGHDRKGRPIPEDDFQLIIENYRKFTSGSLNKNEFSRLGYVVESKWLEDNLVAKRYLPEYIEALEKIESSPYTKKRLGDIARISTGANVAAKYYTTEDKGRPYILVKNITYEGVNFSELKFIDASEIEIPENSIAKKDDILINRCGNAGITTIVPEDLEGGIVCGFVFRVQLEEDYNPYFVTAFLNSDLGRKQMKRIAWGTLIEHITKTDLKNVKIVFPPAEKREDIAKAIQESIQKRVEARKAIRRAQKEFPQILFYPKSSVQDTK